MDRIDPHPAGLSSGLRAAAFPDGDLHRARRRRRRPAAPGVRRRMPQVVQVAVGDAGQALEAGVAEQMKGARAEGARGRAGQRAVQRIGLGQQPDVGAGVAAGERPPRSAAAVADLARGPMLAQQAGDLRPRQTRRLGQKAAQQALVGLAEQGVVEPLQGLRHEGVGVGAALRLQVDPRAPGQELPNLSQGLQALRVESHDHPPMIRDPAPVQAHLSLETTPRSGSSVVGRDSGPQRRITCCTLVDLSSRR